ncbi:hypothetical protein G6F56_012409 [Rhizopus delemar]|nr:hypothetical protein G6F56_012409 [Rhizopus delemar]
MTKDQEERADQCKNEANLLFKEKHFSEAIKKYTEAIELNDKVASFYTNRAFCHLKLESYGYAIADSDKALLVDPNFTKANYRRASANMALGKFKEALKDLKIVSKRAPGDKDAKSKLDECAKIVRRIEFEKAIEHNESKRSVADTLDVNSIGKIEIELFEQH